MTLEEIEEVVRKNYDKTVEFVKTPAAEQYRESQMIRRGIGVPELEHQEVEVSDIVPARQQISRAVPQNQQSCSKGANLATPSSNLKQKRTYSSKEILRTKWGTYKIPEPYKVDFTRDTA